MKKIFTVVSVFTVNFLLLLTITNSYGQKPDSTFDQDGILVSNSDTTGGVKNYWDVIVLKDRRLLALFEEGWLRPDGTGAGGHFLEILDEHGRRDTSFGKMPIQAEWVLDRRVWIVPQGYHFIVRTADGIARYSLSKEIDTSFGDNGVSRICANRFFCSITDMVVAPDNKIVLATVGRGNKRDGITLMRLNADGSMDQSFGSGGFLEISPDDNPFGVALSHPSLRLGFLPDGKMILITGEIGTASNEPPPVTIFMRINDNGTIDRTYGTNGSFSIGRINAPVLVVVPQSFVIQPDGSIILGARIGNALFSELKPHVYRVLKNGVLDVNVDLSLPDNVNVYLLQQDNGKIIVGGSLIITPFESWDIVLRQFNTDGTVDSSFGNNGIIQLDVSTIGDYLRRLVPDKDRFYLVGGTGGSSKGLIARYSQDSVSNAITITNPVTGTVVSAGTPVTVQTSVTPVAGGWAKVEFLNNGVSFASDNVAPYEFSTTGAEPGNYWITARAISNGGDTLESYAVYIIVTACSGAGSIVAQGYLNVTGGRIFDLTSHPSFPDDPDVALTLNSFEFSNTQTNNFGARIRGYVCVPQTGWYTFHIAANSQGELWLSSDESPANKRHIASAYLSTPFRGWNSFSTQKSAPVYLVKGAKYYIEALHAEDGGDDHLSVAWTLPNGVFEAPIPGNRLIPFPDDADNQLLVISNFIAWEKTAEKFQITASPNPSSGIFQISVRSSSTEAIYITVTNALGRVVERINQKQPNTSFAIGGRLRPGIYFVEVRQGSKRERISLMKR
jgi:uncharacterized delta-60 repeat protein